MSSLHNSILCLLLSLSGTFSTLASTREGKLDSYLSAYMDSKYQNTNTQVVLSETLEDSNNPNTEYGIPDNNQNEIDTNDNSSNEPATIIPSTSYGIPDYNQTFRISQSQPQEPKESITQKPIYGQTKYYYYPPTKHTYGSPSPQYGLPTPQYGPSPIMEMTRTPMMLHLENLAQHFMGSQTNISLLLGTGLKVLLKLLVFKFIIKFFAMIALLLIIPKFDMSSMMMMDDDKNEKNKSRTLSDESLDVLTKFVEDSFDVFRTGGSIFPSCTEDTEKKNSNIKLFCDLKKSAKSLDESFSFSKFFPTYFIQYLEKLMVGQTDIGT